MTKTLLSTRPLSGSARDRALLVGRAEIVDQVLKAVRLGANIAVLGARGMGKTSLLRICESRLQDAMTKTVWINGAFMESALDVVDTVAFELQTPRESHRRSTIEEAVSSLTGGRQVYGRPDAVLASIRLLRSKLDAPEEEEARRPVVLVDDLSPEVAHALFGRARDELWTLPLAWIIAGDAARSADYLKPPADSFFGKVLKLQPLAADQAMLALLQRAGDQLADDIIRQRIVEQAEGNPRRLISLATEAQLSPDDGADALDRDSATMARLRELGTPAQRMWEALVPMGQATSNDPSLLDRLGWTRVRASQILNKLEAAGLVESSTEKGQHGRPRKVYRVRTSGGGE